MRYSLLILLCLLPCTTQAAVRISEIAWMGTPESANNEWIELHNDGADPVSLEGWNLGDGINLSIPLSGTLQAGAYGVLERTDDSTVPGTAFMIYTGSLTNAGATLTLTDDTGAIEDRVVGGDSWQNVGGDNATKDTAQLTDNGWVTAPPTPGFGLANYTPPENDGSSDASDTAPTASKIDSGKVIELKVPNVTLGLALQVPDTMYVDQSASLSIAPSGLAPAIEDSLSYEWNFGDLTTASGKSVMHAYESPGSYVVSVHAFYAGHEAVARQSVTVLPVTFALAHNAAGDLLIHNNAKYEVDASGYVLTTTPPVIFPPRTIMLPQSTITLKRGRFAESQKTALYDPNGLAVASFEMPGGLAVTSVRTPSSIAPVAHDQVSEAMASDEPSNFSFKGIVATGSAAATATSIAEAAAPLSTTTPQSASLSSADPKFMAQLLPYAGLAGVIGIGLLALFAARIR